MNDLVLKSIDRHRFILSVRQVYVFASIVAHSSAYLSPCICIHALCIYVSIYKVVCLYRKGCMYVGERELVPRRPATGLPADQRQECRPRQLNNTPHTK